MAQSSSGSPDGDGSGTINDPGAIVGATGEHIIDPATAVGTAAGSDPGAGGSDRPARRRGRPPGSGGTRKASAASLDLGAATGLLVGIHSMLAEITKTPELVMQNDEAKSICDAAGRVLRHYDVQTTQKTLDWVAFGTIVGGAYGTRLLAVNLRKRVTRPAPVPASNGVDTSADATEIMRSHIPIDISGMVQQ